jgi:FKBP-type peptidyl-prolyl cis-trans isomerase
MNKNFAIAVLIGIALLGVFVYFTFGFYQGPTAADPVNKPVKQTVQQATELKIEDTKEGTGQAVKSGDLIVIHYKGTLSDGTTFDSSYDRGEPFETTIGAGQVIEGWDKGIIGLKVGGKRKLTIPPTMGYGDKAAGSIPPNATLIFEVELLEIK